MRHRAHWEEDELAEAKRLKDKGLSWEEVGAHFGRSRSGAQAAVARHLGIAPPKPLDHGDPIGLEMSEVSFRKSAKLGSQILRQACLDLYQRTANRYHISLDDGMACHLGYHARPVIPGCERAIRGQFAARKLAA